jgi:hypothetical protein
MGFSDGVLGETWIYLIVKEDRAFCNGVDHVFHAKAVWSKLSHNIVNVRLVSELDISA